MSAVPAGSQLSTHPVHAAAIAAIAVSFLLLKKVGGPNRMHATSHAQLAVVAGEPSETQHCFGFHMLPMLLG